MSTFDIRSTDLSLEMPCDEQGEAISGLVLDRADKIRLIALDGGDDPGAALVHLTAGMAQDLGHWLLEAAEAISR